MNFIFTYSAFLRAVFLGFAVVVAVAPTFLEAVRLIFSLMALRLLALPKEPMVLFPFADFLSPLPMSLVQILGKYKTRNCKLQITKSKNVTSNE